MSRVWPQQQAVVPALGAVSAELPWMVEVEVVARHV
jgi:hypothetical protein